MDAEARSLQNDFFNTARKERTTVTVFLGNGKKLVGRIKSFDKFTVLLESHQGEQIIFKHAISTVSTAPRPASSMGHAGDSGHAAGAASDERRRPASSGAGRPLEKMDKPDK